MADLTWRLAPDAVLARAVTDVEIDGNVQQVTQLLTLTFSGRRPERVRLTSDRPIAALRVSPGTVEAAGGGWDLLLPSGLDREATFRLTFTAPADEANPAAIGVAYLRTDGPSADHVVRVWDRAGRVLALPDRSVVWREAPVEVVSDRASLPAIVVRANGLAGRLVLAIRSAGGDRAALWQVNRAQLEVRVANGHTVDVRAVFWVRPVAGREAVFELPESAGDAEVRVAGKLAAARPADTRPWRVPLPGNVPVPIPVEIRYRVDAGPGGRLVPPRLVGAVYDSVRWSVVAPPGRVPLVVGGSVPGAWSYRALFAALGISAGPTVSDADGTTADDFTSDGEPGGSGRRVTVWQDQPEPIRVAVVPYPAWFAGCSAATLLAGLALISFHRRVRTVAALLWCVVVAVTVQAASQPVSQALVAAVPGALALLLTVILYRLARGRHRRRLSRLPGFARSDSSLVRPSAVRPRDTTTIDAVAAERPASGVPSLR